MPSRDRPEPAVAHRLAALTERTPARRGGAARPRAGARDDLPRTVPPGAPGPAAGESATAPRVPVSPAVPEDATEGLPSWRPRRWPATGPVSGDVPARLAPALPSAPAWAPADRAPEERAPEPRAPEARAPEARAPEERAPAGWAPEEWAPEERVPAERAREERAPAGWTPTVHGDPSPAPPRPATLDALAQAAQRVGPRPDGHAAGARPARRVRWAVAPRAAAAAALAVALLAGGVALRASTAPSAPPVTLPSPRASGTATSASGAPSAPASPPSAVVHVVGAVGTPGVVTLAADARVADAVAAAGGGTPDADLAALNLARTVVDGEQLRVPRAGEAPVAPPAAGAGAATAPGGAGGDAGAAGDARTGSGAAGLVDLNTADLAALDALPGVGPVLAQRILDRRAESPFSSVDELDEVSGIGPAVLERLRPLVGV